MKQYPQKKMKKPVTSGNTEVVPGEGNQDTVDAKLTPGEFIMPQDSTAAIGVDKLRAMKDATHTPVNQPQLGIEGMPRMANGDIVGTRPESVEKPSIANFIKDRIRHYTGNESTIIPSTAPVGLEQRMNAAGEGTTQAPPRVVQSEDAPPPAIKFANGGKVPGGIVRMADGDEVDPPQMRYADQMKKVGALPGKAFSWMVSAPGSGGPLDRSAPSPASTAPPTTPDANKPQASPVNLSQSAAETSRLASAEPPSSVQFSAPTPSTDVGYGINKSVVGGKTAYSNVPDETAPPGRGFVGGISGIDNTTQNQLVDQKITGMNRTANLQREVNNLNAGESASGPTGPSVASMGSGNFGDDLRAKTDAGKLTPRRQFDYAQLAQGAQLAQQAHAAQFGIAGIQQGGENARNAATIQANLGIHGNANATQERIHAANNASAKSIEESRASALRKNAQIVHGGPKNIYENGIITGTEMTPDRILTMNEDGTPKLTSIPVDTPMASKAALPTGMKRQVGTSGGKPVYEDANGKRFTGA